MHHPTSSELQLADSHLEIILKDILINLGIHFPLHNGKQSMSRDSKADPILMLYCWEDVFFLRHKQRCMFFWNNYICPLEIFPVVLWSVKVVFGKL